MHHFSKPLIAILRGLQPNAAKDVVEILYDAGFSIVEVPLNSPDPLRSIETIANHFGDRMLVGAGTVLSEANVVDVMNAGGKIIVSPNCNINVIHTTKKHNLYAFPGVFSPTEAFAALDAGADGIKFFPCDALPPSVIKAYKAVLPKDVITIAVGGISASNMKDYLNVGISGFGFGSCLFTPSMSYDEIEKQARSIMQVWQEFES